MGIGHVSCQRQGPSRGEETENAENKESGRRAKCAVSNTGKFCVLNSHWKEGRMGGL